MKVILTEEQFNQLIQEEVIEEGLISSLLGLNDPNKFVRRIVLALLLGTITIGSLPGIIRTVSQRNPAIENVSQDKLYNKIKGIWQNMKDKDAQITDNMQGYVRRQKEKATEISSNALSKICFWETRHDFGYQMQPKDLQGYYVKGETKKTYGYGLRSHPNGQDMEKVKAVYSQNELEQLFKQKIANETNWVLKWAKEHNVTLGQGQLDAFVSAVYNYGRSGFLRTGIPAMIAENPDNPKIADTWSHLSDAKAAKYPGLVGRRQQEAQWYDSDTKKS